MASSLPVFKEYGTNEKSIKQEFIDEYGKRLRIPKADTIFADFHPLLNDHVITINKIDFPTASRGKH